MKIVLLLLQTIVIVLLSPLVSGIIRKIKNDIRMRKGASVLQPYYTLLKLFHKEEVVSEHSSWIFRCTPYVVLSSTTAASLLVPALLPGVSLDGMGDFVVLIMLLALGRFFLALSGLDAGSAFGGMGSSREMFISSLAEPVALLSVFAVALSRESTSLNVIGASPAIYLSSLIAAVSLFIVTLAETSRLPVDNQETHLELTMVHEAMLLEYSGRSLALIELASHIKQIIFFSLLALIIFPFGQPVSAGIVPVFSALSFYAFKLLAVGFAVAILEVSVAKMRLFRVADLLALALAIAVIAVVVSALGL